MKSMITIFFSFLIIGFQTEWKTVNFGKFQIDLPSSWKVIDTQGIDSFVRKIITDSNDTLSFDLGYYSCDLEERLNRILALNSEKELFIGEGLDTNDFIFVEFIHEDTYKEYLKQNREEIEVDGFKAFLVRPKEVSNGITGVYFDSIGHGTMGNIKLNFYGRNLDEIEQNQLITAIQTIKIKK